MQIRKILVPVDYSRASRAALFDALSLARTMRPAARVEALHVAAETTEADGARMQGACFLRGCDSPDVGLHVAISGAPLPEAISVAARDGGYDLIVIGSSEQGRTASALIREAGVPVLATHLGDPDALAAML